MKIGTIVNFEGSWGSGVATLTLKVGKKTQRVYCENAPTVRALAGLFPEVIAIGHRVNLPILVGKRIAFALDDMGMLAGIASEEVMA